MGWIIGGEIRSPLPPAALHIFCQSLVT
uniref:Uncharacterized protein n=1 Tax=Anguilla anguilla TaxID=7936 RepID=A0A0E9R2N7_ANGAN